MNTIEQEARVIAKKKTVLNDKIKFSTEADLRTAEYVCYKAAIEMADFIQRTILSPNGFAEAGGQFLKTSQTKENQQSTEQLLLKHAVIKSVCDCGNCFMIYINQNGEKTCFNCLKPISQTVRRKNQ